MANLLDNINQACADFTNIKTAITDSGVAVASGTPSSEYADKVREVYESGKKSEYDRFWDAFQQNGNRANYSNAFYLGWDDISYNPKYPIVVKVNNTLNGAYSYSQITDTKVDIEVVSPGRIGATFYSANKLATIKKIILDANVGITSDAFGYCPALKNITFDGTIGVSLDIQRSTLLTKASITNIIEHLSSTASGQTVTFSKVAKENAFTADEWATLIATKSNWTFSLV